jgi:hypothetical protein
MSETPRQQKSIEEMETLADAEHYLRDVGGLSRSHAVAFVSRVKRIALGRRRFSLFRRLRLWLAPARRDGERRFS